MGRDLTLNLSYPLFQPEFIQSATIFPSCSQHIEKAVRGHEDNHPARNDINEVQHDLPKFGQLDIFLVRILPIIFIIVTQWYIPKLGRSVYQTWIVGRRHEVLSWQLVFECWTLEWYDHKKTWSVCLRVTRKIIDWSRPRSRIARRYNGNEWNGTERDYLQGTSYRRQEPPIGQLQQYLESVLPDSDADI